MTSKVIGPGHADCDPLHPTEDEARQAYDRELAFLDAELARLFEGLERRGLLQFSVLVVTSDHGEALGEHGFQKHGWTLYDAVVRVPLFVQPVDPERAGTVRHEPIGGAQVHDLVVAELGLAKPPAVRADAIASEWFRVPGSKEVPALAGHDVERDLVSWVEPPLKLIVSSRGEVEAYDLEADPGELRPVELDPETVERAVERARRWWAEHPPAPPSGAAPSGDAARLRALGYAGDG